jgi:hypothetical protein
MIDLLDLVIDEERLVDLHGRHQRFERASGTALGCPVRIPERPDYWGVSRL